jgi:hypothetical protein
MSVGSGYECDYNAKLREVKISNAKMKENGCWLACRNEMKAGYWMLDEFGSGFNTEMLYA